MKSCRNFAKIRNIDINCYVYETNNTNNSLFVCKTSCCKRLSLVSSSYREWTKLFKEFKMLFKPSQGLNTCQYKKTLTRLHHFYGSWIWQIFIGYRSAWFPLLYKSYPRVWHLCNLPCVYALSRLISIARYDFKSPRNCFEGQNMKFTVNMFLTCILYCALGPAVIRRSKTQVTGHCFTDTVTTLTPSYC